MTHATLVHSFGNIPTPTINLSQTHAEFARLLECEGLDCILITAQDAFLSEYTALSNNQRHALSGFTGSTGDGIFISRAVANEAGLKGQFVLFVDGRYHLQADQECDPALVTVIKLSLSESIETSMLEWITNHTLPQKAVGLDGSRTSWKRFQTITALTQRHGIRLKSFLGTEVSDGMNLAGWSTSRPITPLAQHTTGRTLGGNITALQAQFPPGISPEKACVLTCASDDAAWLLNARGYHMPYQSSFLAYTALIGRTVILYLPTGTDACPVEIPSAVPGADGYTLRVVRGGLDDFQKEFRAHSGIEAVLFSDKVMNALLPQAATAVWTNARLIPHFEGLELLRARKTPEEIASMRDSFLRSSRAIAETLRWVKASTPLPAKTSTPDVAYTSPVSEADLADKISREYARQGALELSFRSIAGSGAHGAIIHYSTPDPRTPLAPGDLVLLDSGAYYESGLATDCTRVVYAPAANGAAPAPWQKEIYTLTLKSCVAGMAAVIPKNQSGREADALIRQVVKDKGYDYNHGTGHGVGIHVHESGIRLSPVSTYGFTEHAVSSIEPGIYLAGKGGVRIENVAAVAQHPEKPDAFCFDNFVYVGFDWDLIDVGMLTAEEKAYLKGYEDKCRSLGTEVTACPL